MHHGDPDRSHVIVPGRDRRCRYEFLLKPGEGISGEQPSFELVRDLLRPYRTLEPGQIERAVNYRFHALLADRLRQGRCFLLGDAVHMMPPFAGQGLNSGLRDAVNLSWKIAEVLAGRASDALLDTYETERRPHAKATIDLSVRLGRIVMTTSRRQAQARDLLIAAAMRTRPGRRYLTEMRYHPSTRPRAGAVVRDSQARDQELIGQLLPQPRVLRGPGHDLIRLDDTLGSGWSLLGVDVTAADWALATVGAALPAGTRIDVVLGDRAAREHDGRQAITNADGKLDALLGRLRRRFVLVRPDRIVAAIFPAGNGRQVAGTLAAAGIRAEQLHHRSPGPASRQPTAEPPQPASSPPPPAVLTRPVAHPGTGGTRP